MGLLEFRFWFLGGFRPYGAWFLWTFRFLQTFRPYGALKFAPHSLLTSPLSTHHFLLSTFYTQLTTHNSHCVLLLRHMAIHLPHNIICRDREAIVVEDGNQLPRIDLELIDQDTSHLAIPVLLDNKYDLMF